ncbi:MAG: site-2 protease family protein [Candidatus Bipolaricaulia bacterium]
MNVERVLVIILQFIAILGAVVFHEYAHAWVAYRLGDPTARRQGRLTLNPIPHIDPFGTIILPALLAIFGGVIFGWAKPVPIDPRHFKKPYQGMLLVAFAGPAMNGIMALLGALIWRFIRAAIRSPFSPDSLGGEVATNSLEALALLLGWFVIINVILGVFNLIPIPPLDGSRILNYFLPPEGKIFMARIEPFGFLIIFALLWLGLLGRIIAPVAIWAQRLLLG